MTTEILFFIITITLIGLLIYREQQHQKTLKIILAARLSRDVSEFKSAITEEKLVEEEKPPEEIPLEDMPAKEMLGVLNKK